MNTTTLPRPVVSMVDHLRRDMGVALDARAGRFTHAGIAVDLGPAPDWFAAGLPDDDEWRIEWVKLYEGMDLGHAYTVTGDASFLTAWEDLVESFCAHVPIGWDSPDVTARRMQNWLHAWQRFAAAPAFPGLRSGLAERIVDRLRADADHVVANLTAERNHRTLELYGVLLVNLAIDADLDRASAVLDLIADNAATDIWDDGVHRECSSDYHLIVLRSFVGAIANARAAGLAVPPVLVDRTLLACEFALHIQRPDGTTPALSDGDPDDFGDLLVQAGRLFDRPDLMWAGTGGRDGSPPRRRLVSFDVAGYHVQRSGWGDGPTPYADERLCIFDCGPIGDGGHGHYDQLSIEVAGAGRSLVVDPGRYSYAAGTPEASRWRHAFKGTAAHNTVSVDGRDQIAFRPGKPRGALSSARLIGRWTTDGLDVVAGTVTSPHYDAIHTRAVAFIDDAYWIVHDRLRADRRHRYEARWHLAPDAWGRTEVEVVNGQVAVRAPGVGIVVPSWCGQVSVTDGWVSPEYGVKVPAPVVVVTVDGRSDADMVTAIVPGDEYPIMTAAAGDGGGHAETLWPNDRRERISWSLGAVVDAQWDRSAP